MFPLFDAHLHLDFSCFDQDRDKLILACQKQGIEKFFVAGVNRHNWEKCIALLQFPQVFLALGCHPLFLQDFEWEDLSILSYLIVKNKVQAIGEIGLDFYSPLTVDEKIKQENVFIAQLKLARQFNLPVVLHIRKAYDQVLKYLRQYPVKGGIAHAFSGSEQQANQLIQMGFKLGFGGAMTYSGSRKIRHLVSILPLSAIVLETDSPDMPPVWMEKTERNTPLSLNAYLDCVCKLRLEERSVIAHQVFKNTIEIFQ